VDAKHCTDTMGSVRFGQVNYPGGIKAVSSSCLGAYDVIVTTAHLKTTISMIFHSLFRDGHTYLDPSHFVRDISCRRPCAANVLQSQSKRPSG
jgi:hypothetical protein